VLVVEAAETPGGCINTIDLPDARGRLELGAFEHGGIRVNGVAGDLELEDRFGLDFHLRDELFLAPADDGTALAFWNSLERTVEEMQLTVGKRDAEAYREFSRWAKAGADVLRQADSGPPPTLRELAALADAALGSEGVRLMQALLASASGLASGWFEDDRLRGAIEHWAAHSQVPPDDPGTGAGALFMSASHGEPAARPRGGSRATVDALVRCLDEAGGRLRCGAPVERIVVAGGRAAGLVVAGEQVTASKAIVSQVDARRVFEGLLSPDVVPDSLLGEIRRIHVGLHNVGVLKADAIVDGVPHLPGPAGFERSLILSPNTGTDIQRAFAEIRLGVMPKRPPLMVGFPSALEPGWAPEGQSSVWLETWGPFRPANGEWTEAGLEQAGDHMWSTLERALGTKFSILERKVTSPSDWIERTGNLHANPNHVEMSIDQLLGMRPSPSLARYRTPISGLFLTGSGTHPGGGVTGATGRNAAAVVLEDLGIRRRSRGAQLRAQLSLLRDAARSARALRKAA
jgi:beta-carotene ketolase (CrtO type)